MRQAGKVHVVYRLQLIWRPFCLQYAPGFLMRRSSPFTPTLNKTLSPDQALTRQMGQVWSLSTFSVPSSKPEDATETWRSSRASLTIASFASTAAATSTGFPSARNTEADQRFRDIYGVAGSCASGSSLIFVFFAIMASATSTGCDAREDHCPSSTVVSCG